MIRLRQTIERGMRHRWLGPLFVILFCLLLAMVYLHALHDGQSGTELGALCIGITMVIGAVLLIRLRFQAPLPGGVQHAAVEQHVSLAGPRLREGETDRVGPLA